VIRGRRGTDGDANGAVAVGAPHDHAAQGVEHGGVGMAVVVVADGDHRGVRAHRREEPRRVRVASVVGHLHDVRGQPGGVAEQPGLGALLGVAGEQQPPVAARYPQHDGVGVRVAAERAVRRRAQHLHGGVPEREPPARGDRHDGYAGSRGGAVAGAHRRRQRLAACAQRDGRHEEGADVEVAEHRSQPGDVVVVGVAHHDRLEAAHAAAAEVGEGGVRLGTTVVEQPRGRMTGDLDEERVSLADGERGEGQRLHAR